MYEASDDSVLAKGEYLISLGKRSGAGGEVHWRVELCWCPSETLADETARFQGRVAVWLLSEVTHEHARLVDEVIEKHQELMEFVRTTGGTPEG
jgi:hypothetical protein